MKWEYCITELHFANPQRRQQTIDELNKLGAEGWEAVGFIEMQSQWGVSTGLLMKRKVG